MAYPEAVYALRKVIEDIDWPTKGFSSPPKVAVSHFDFEVAQQAQDSGAYTRPNFITLQRFGGEDVNTNDGWVSLSGQVIQVNPYSQRRADVAKMMSAIHEALSGFRGQAPSLNDSPTIRYCLLDEMFDLMDEETSYYGMEMVFLVGVAPHS